MYGVILFTQLMLIIPHILSSSGIHLRSTSEITQGRRDDNGNSSLILNYERAQRHRLRTRFPRIVNDHEEAYKKLKSYNQIIQSRVRGKYNLTSIYGFSQSHISNLSKLPDEIDYRTMGYVTSVDDQGACNACWAFAVVGAVEALMAKTRGILMKLSTQQLIDCNEFGGGCNGGSISSSFLYLEYKGLHTARHYPYTAQEQTCRYNPYFPTFKFSGFVCFPFLDETSLKFYVANVRPIITHIVATRSFFGYKTGIYSTDQCKPGMKNNHAVLIVGYGSENKTDYWIIKNSHGIKSGEGGYIRFQRNIGLCNIGSEVLWPFIN